MNLYAHANEDSYPCYSNILHSIDLKKLLFAFPIFQMIKHFEKANRICHANRLGYAQTITSKFTKINTPLLPLDLNGPRMDASNFRIWVKLKCLLFYLVVSIFQWTYLTGVKYTYRIYVKIKWKQFKNKSL